MVAETERDRFFDELKSNYGKRIEEFDTFSKHFSSISSDFRSQYLIGVLDILQFYVDLYKKFTKNLPDWYDAKFMIGQSQMITDIWVKSLQGIDRFYTQFADSAIKNIRLYNKGCIQMMQYTERFYDLQEGVPQISKNTMIEIIKQAKRTNHGNPKQVSEEPEKRKKNQTMEKNLE